MSTSSRVRAAAWTAAAILAAIAGLQLYWAVGGTWGLHDASGGALDDPTAFEQIASAIAAGVFLAFAGVVLARAGYWSGRVPSQVARIGCWVVAGALALGALANFTAQTDFERFVNGPVALLAALLTFVVARSEAPAAPTRPASPRTRAPTPVH